LMVRILINLLSRPAPSWPKLFLILSMSIG
jgi:hypothetical protein